MGKALRLQEWLQSNILSIGFFLLFVAVGFYGHPNQGGPLLALPFNLFGWAVASWITGLGIFLIANMGQFTYPRLYSFFVLFPVIVIASSLMADIDLPIAWLFRQLYILGGLFFLFTLFQLSLTQRKLDNLLLILVLATGLQSCIGTLHTLDISYFPSWLPLNPDFVPRGIFQQVNVLASFLATGVCMSLYLISRPGFLTSSLLVKISVVVSFSLAVYVITASGSRVGVLSVLISVPIILLARYKQLRRHKKLLLIMAIISAIGIYAGQAGLDKTINKTVQLADESYSTARVAIYSIGIELVKDEPISGYGLGSFLKAWNPQASDYIERHPDAYLPTVTTHPHNEILFWMIEGGLLAVAGLLAVVVGIVIGLIRCGLQRGGAYAAMLIPISLHTMVEHPFYGSSLHWFLWLFLIFLILKHQIITTQLSLSRIAARTIQSSGIFLAVGVSIFSINTMRAELDLFNFIYNRNLSSPPYLQLALNNIYTGTRAEITGRRSTLYANIENNNREQVQGFELWAQDYMKKSPELKMYEDLISASVFLRPEGKGCDVIASALAMYAHVETLEIAFNNECK